MEEAMKILFSATVAAFALSVVPAQAQDLNQMLRQLAPQVFEPQQQEPQRYPGRVERRDDRDFHRDRGRAAREEERRLREDQRRLAERQERLEERQRELERERRRIERERRR
ncbi:hypothetical protein [Roseococcus microcysteis]|uniref:hypothetical protein n=1 Tax=Roseococcus microcysteis TaxID=2771361 RepID=UPI00168B41E4|nr:hypothetical protein [Roseococcus microcysteis]